MSSEAKLLFVEHLAKTNPHGQSLVARVKMTSSVGPETNAWIVSRFEITELKGYGSDYYTRLRLETRSFGS